MALRHLQLLRNATPINKSRAQAKAAADEVKANLKDGELIVARYLIDSTQPESSANTAVAVGHKVSGDTGYLVWNDPQEVKELVESAATASTQALEQAVGVGHGESAITFEDVQYISSGSAKDALELLDSTLATVSGTTDSGITAFNEYTTSVVGAASGSSGLGVSGTNVTSGMTVKEAVDALDKAIESGDTANDNLRKAVGAAEGASAMTFTGTYISGQTTVKAALETLDSNLHTVSGDLDTLETTYSGYTATTNANTADTRTMASNLDTVVGVASGATSLGVENGHYVESDDSVKEAITALDAKLYEVGSGATEDLENLRKAVGVTSGQSAITITNAHYATGDTVVTALTQLDTQLYSATTKAENAQAALGSSGTTLNASGKYVTSGQTAKAAVETLDSNLFTVSGKAESALTYVGNIDSVVGVQNTATTFATSGTIASSQTTVKTAVEALDGAIVDLSGKTASDDDLEALAKAVGTTKGSSAITFGNTNYIGTSGSASGALVTLDSTVKGVRDDVDTVSGALNTHISAYTAYTSATDSKINTISGKADNAQTALGTTGTTLGVNGNYVTNGMNVQTAVDTLDDVEKATRDTIGITGSGSGLSLSTQHYISGDTTVVSALTDLDSSLFELSGAVSTNKVNGSTSISAVTGADGTTVSVRLNSTATDGTIASGDTAMHSNIISATTTGLLALADLHYDSALNKLTFVNTNGYREIQLSGLNALSSATYDAATEQIVLVWKLADGTTSETRISVSGIITEYAFQAASGGGAAPTTGENGEHNVYLFADRTGQPGSSSTPVYGEVSIFDCGTY